MYASPNGNESLSSPHRLKLGYTYRTMYSLGPLPKVGNSGRVIGAHQKIDRDARRNIEPYLDSQHTFPDITSILEFEGINGPDGIKLKSPGVDEPWHFIDPENDTDRVLLDDIRDRQTNLCAALAANDMTKASFEAAWLAHAVVDGLTPAHHEPYEEIMKALREEADGIHVSKVRDKVIMPGGGSVRQFVKNNWEFWGAGGVMTTHTLFEAGVASTIKTLRFDGIVPSKSEFDRLKTEGFEQIYRDAIAGVVTLDLYTKYKKRGWTRSVASMVRNSLMPIIIRMVILAWYDSYNRSKEGGKK